MVQCALLFSLILNYFLNFLVIFSLTHCLLWSVLLNFHKFVSFSNFLLLLIPNFITLWSENILFMISILLNLLRLVLWHNIQSILKNVLCALGKNADSVVVECLCVSVRSMFTELFESSIFLLIICLIVLSIIESGLSMFPIFVAD